MGCITLNGVYQTGETCFGRELPLALDQPGEAPTEPTYYTLTCQAFREDGRTIGISVFAHDMTEQVRAPNRLATFYPRS